MKGKTLIGEQGKGQGVRFSPSASDGGAIAEETLNRVLASLAESKAEDVVCIDIAGKSALGDHMVIASGRSNRHVTAIGDQVLRTLKSGGFGRAKVEGLDHGDWVLIDAGDVIVHLFRPEIRNFYNLEKMWTAPRPEEGTVH